MDNLIGPNGLFKELGTTVLLITHASTSFHYTRSLRPLHIRLSMDRQYTHRRTAQHLPLADYIIVIGEDGQIAEQGTWADLRASAGYISQVVVKESNGSHSTNDNNSRTREGFQGSAPKEQKEELKDLSRKTGDITLYSMHNCPRFSNESRFTYY